MAYEPSAPPIGGDVDALARWLAQEFLHIAENFVGVDSVQLSVLHAEPARPRNGALVLADGTNWNPGSGAGFYGRSAGAWVFLG